MLAKTLGIHLAILLGDTVSRPAAPGVLDAFEQLEVTNATRGASGFQMRFKVHKGRGLDYMLLQHDELKPLARVIVVVTLGVVPEVLVDGVITHQQLQPGTGDADGGSLTVTGRDISLLLDLEEKNAAYPNQPDSLIVSQVLARYAKYGLVPSPQPTTDVPLSIERIPRQHETDLQFIQRLAQRNGYVFYIEPTIPGAGTAYWGRENRLGVPQPALTVDMGAATNVKQLNFANDGLAAVQPSGSTMEPISKTALPIPPLPSLNLPPLAAALAPARREVLERDTANLNPMQALAAAVATANAAPDAVTGSGELDSLRYGHVLRAHRLVGVRGAGRSHDGHYRVQKVTHRIERGSYTQSFTISREGTGALAPVVRT